MRPILIALAATALLAACGRGAATSLPAARSPGLQAPGELYELAEHLIAP